METQKQTGKRIQLSRPDHPFCLFWVQTLLIFAVTISPLAAQTGTQREYEIKAAFLYNFLKYIDWPSEALPDNSPTVTIGFLGENPFGNALQALDNKTVRGKKLVLKELQSPQEATSCQMVFISSSERERLPSILAALKTASVLTVGEVDGFAQRGGIINLVADKNTVRLEINPDAAGQARLNISSQLLKLPKVKIVRG